MTPIYIDITNIPELKTFTGISRVVSEIVSHFIRDGVDVRLLAYFPDRHAFRIVDSAKFLDAVNGLPEDKTECYTDTCVAPDELEHGSVFFDVNSAWHTLPNRSWLLPRLKARQIRIIPLIHDIIPIRCPQYMVGQTLVRFMEYIVAHMNCASEIVVTTDAVRNDLKELFNELGIDEKPIRKIGLGADFSTGSKSSSEEGSVDPEIENIIRDRRFLLTVGTVEPRKNQKILVEAYEKALADMDMDVIIVGKIGWDTDELISRIENNPNYNKGLYVLSDVDDATLDLLYSRAFMVVFPSYAEGYGLPTIETLIKGIPIACSDIPVMREVGGGFCDYFSPDDAGQLISIVRKYVDDHDLYRAKRREIEKDYHPPRWSDTASVMEQFMLTDDSKHFPHKPVKQVVFLSARPDPILATLPYIEEFMPFISELVVCCPDPMAGYMHEKYSGRLKLTTITDGELLGSNTLPPDHSTRNFFLRCLAMEQPAIDDEFIMCDDDYRPLRPITEEVFYKDGKYRGYYFSDISKWKYMSPKLFSYDYCHMRTLKFLRHHGYPTLMYSSHQPQIINKQWYRELIRRYPDIIRKGYDEWSTYFNYIASEHREQFMPCEFVTLSWPNVGGDTKGVEQQDFIFENFYEDNYSGKRPFSRFVPHFTSAENVMRENEEKIKIALGFREERRSERLRTEKYESEYEERYSEVPSISAYYTGERSVAPELGVPVYIKMSRTGENFMRFSIARSSCSAANIYTVIFVLNVVRGEKLYPSRIIEVAPQQEYTQINWRLNYDIPEGEKVLLRVTAGLKTDSVPTVKELPIIFTD